jgi:hypothetical protein
VIATIPKGYRLRDSRANQSSADAEFDEIAPRDLEASVLKSCMAHVFDFETIDDATAIDRNDMHCAAL